MAWLLKIFEILQIVKTWSGRLAAALKIGASVAETVEKAIDEIDDIPAEQKEEDK